MGTITLKAATDASIRSFSSGEVTNFGHYNFKYSKPLPYAGGLFCQKIFGPLHDYHCSCNVSRRLAFDSTTFKGQACNTCGVEYIPSISRNNRFGHIELNCYYLNPLMIKAVGAILAVGEKFMKAIANGTSGIKLSASSNGVLYDSNGCRYNIVLDTDSTTVTGINSLVLEFKKFGIDGDITMMENRSTPGRAYFSKGYSLYDMFNTTVYVTPASNRDLRNLGDRVAYDEVNAFYTRLVRESLRIKAIKAMDLESITEEEKVQIVKMESIMIQKLITMMNVSGGEYGNVPIQARIESLKGKGGLLRGNLLGKRVDFSARSVIVSGPDLPIDTVGLPLYMVYELIKPILIRELTNIIQEESELGKAGAMKAAITEVKHKSARAVALVEYLSKSQMVLMNRAPSLHRYSAMTFKIKITYGKCILFPPLACSPFNADFDGDTLAVHLILTDKAMDQTKITNFSSNYMSSADYDKPNANLSHEMVVGAFLLSMM